MYGAVWVVGCVCLCVFFASSLFSFFTFLFYHFLNIL